MDWQMGQHLKGLCCKCTKPAVTRWHCREHADYHSQAQRDRRMITREEKKHQRGR
jgi:hypothetical protein